MLFLWHEQGVVPATSTRGSLSEELLPRVLEMSWQVKGKHTLLGCLLEHFETTEVHNKHILD